MNSIRTERAAWKQAEDIALPGGSFSDAYTEAMKASRRFVLDLTEHHRERQRRRIRSLSPDEIAELLRNTGEEGEEESEDEPTGGLRLIRRDEP